MKLSTISFLGIKAITCAVFLASVSNAATAGKVRSSLGDVTRQREQSSEWDALRVGSKVYHSDHIKTGKESEAIVGLPDGSLLTIEERSEVHLAELFSENGEYRTTIDIRKGRLSFSAQKQKLKSKFNFLTGTGTASIRGTEGTIGEEDGNFVAGLRNGALEIEIGGEKFNIKGGQTAIRRKGKKAETFDLASSGDPVFSRRVAALLADSTLSVEDFDKKIRHDDSTYQKKLKEAVSGRDCSIDALPDTVRTPKITVKGKCPADVKLNIYGEPVSLASGGSFEKSVELDSSATGFKTLKLTCSIGKFTYPCGEVSTNLWPTQAETTESALTLNTQSPVNICGEGLLIEGSYKTSKPEATLILKIGKNYKSENIIKMADGNSHNFSQKVLITDENGLWNEKKAVLEYETDNWNESKEIELVVNKACKAVNQVPPKVSFVSYDSLHCNAMVSVDNIADDIAIFSVNVDNSVKSSKVFKKAGNERLKLEKGIHEYEFIAEDQAQNVASEKRVLGCYPSKRFSIDLYGSTLEKLRVPRPPVGMKDVIQKSLRFRIRLAENDPNYIHKVVIKQNGVDILTESAGQIQSLDYEVPVELTRNKNNVFDVYVTHKSGYKSHVQKTYEVR